MLNADRLVPAHQSLPDPEPSLESTQNPLYERSDLRDFLALLRRHAVLIGVVTILTGALTYAVTKQEAAQFRSTTTLLYSEPANAGAGDPARAVSTFVGMSASSAVLTPVATRHGMTLSHLRKLLSVSGDPNADLITISVNSGSAEEAAAITKGVAKTLITYMESDAKHLLRGQIASLRHQLQTFAGRTDPNSLAAASDLRLQVAQAKAQLNVASSPLSVLSPAVVPSGPVSPKPARDAGIGLLAGLVLGVMLAAIRDRLDRRIREIEDIEAIYRAPTLGLVPFTNGRQRTSRAAYVADFSSRDALADAYRTIRTNLTLLKMNEDGPSVVVVTSGTAEEGKSSVTANLAQALSVTGRRVLAVSADLHNPTLHQYFASSYARNDLPSYGSDDGHSVRTLDDPTLNAYFATGYGADDAPGDSSIESRRLRRATRPMQRWTGPTRPKGLVQVLAGEVGLDDAVHTVPLSAQERERGGALHLLADNSTFFDPAVLLSSDAMRQLLEQASKSYDVIVLDTPPMLANADATLLAQRANVLVVVARLNHLTRNQARRAVQVMASMRLAPSGIIVTGEFEEPTYGYGYAHHVEYKRDSVGSEVDGRSRATS